MTLCIHVSRTSSDDKWDTYHLQCPDSPDPHLEFTFNTPDIVELYTLPPASSSRFPPEEEELLRHTYRVAVGQVVTFDVSSQACQCNATDDSLVRFSSSVSPLIIMVEAARCNVSKQS